MAKRDQGGYDWLVKLLVIGDSGVGKTNVMTRFCDNSYTPNHLTTIGIDFKIKTIEIDGKKIKLQVWDTAGQERFKTITQSYYKGAMGIILCYAINDRETFQNIEQWIKQIKTHAQENVCKILIGNKSDMKDRQVTYEEGKSLADNYGVQFLETSAKETVNINETFQAISKEIKDKLLVNDSTTPQNVQSNRLKSQDLNKKKKGGCC